MVSGASAPSSRENPSRLRMIFTGPNGLRSGWRLITFLFIFVTGLVLPALLLGHFVPQIPRWAKSQPIDRFSPSYLIAYESWLTSFLFFAAFVMSKIEKRVFADYGLPGGGAFGRKFWLGAVIGLGGVSLQMGLLAAFGAYVPGSLGLGVGNAVKYALVWAVAFFLAAVNEEFLFRGYAQMTLTSGIGFWTAALILSIGFAVLHLGNAGERWPGILMLFCFGLLAAFMLRRTGDLWFPIGLHAAWDWAHVFLFSVPIAGMMGTHQLLHPSLRGPHWLTGGSVGPDGSVIAFAVLLSIAALTNRTHLPTRTDPAK